MNSKEGTQLRKDLDKLNKNFERLVDELISSQVLYKNPYRGSLSVYEHFFSSLSVKTTLKGLNDRLSKILDHLGLELEWIECKPHYELKEKKEKE